MTRAHIGLFVMGPGKKTPLEWPLNHLVDFLEERSAAINIRDRCHWYLMCQNCCQPGLIIDCKFKPKCVGCDGAPHATRNCPRAEEDAISTSASEPITAEDGIQRDVLNPPRVNFSDSRRSKKNSASRASSNKGQKRASEWDAELLKQDEARKKGQPAYYTVTFNKGFSLQFSWKDAKGKIGASDKVKLQPDWGMTRAEFEAKFRHDLYWENAMRSFNRDLTIATGRSMLRKFAKAKGSAFPLGGEHLLGDLMMKPLTRDVDDATIAKIEAHRAIIASNPLPADAIVSSLIAYFRCLVPHHQTQHRPARQYLELTRRGEERRGGGEEERRRGSKRIVNP
ncbi:hypothetical protein FNAPI_4512 [Fusarium napiforme]|uniref:Uncharacterized protein n=1 Tax=Fusarium napiforme TaxID=42672 RepID=A0A8H5NCQ0_9HYPO|nr:hypothetical protein FNAPI_4512 [Fusarium napiforme]